MNFENQKTELDNEKEKNKSRIDVAHKVLDDFTFLKEGEKVLFLTDSNPDNTDRELIKAFQDDLKNRDIEFAEIIADGKLTNEESLKRIEDCDLIWDSWGMNETEVDFYALTKHLADTDKRMVWASGVKVDLLDDDGALTEKKEDLEYRMEKMEGYLKNMVGMRVRSVYGTDLTVKFKKEERKWHKDTGEIKPGKWDNLPGGEIYTTPDEENINGVCNE